MCPPSLSSPPSPARRRWLRAGTAALFAPALLAAPAASAQDSEETRQAKQAARQAAGGRRRTPIAATAHDAASGLPPHAPRPVPPKARCPVCGMYPARFPRWAAQIIYADGAAHFFDSPIDLLVFLADMPRYAPDRKKADIRSRWVTDASAPAGQSAWTPLESAWFVRDSLIYGPMRSPDLPAFASQAAAQTFANKTRGQPLPYAQISAKLIDELANQRVIEHVGHNHRR